MKLTGLLTLPIIVMSFSASADRPAMESRPTTITPEPVMAEPAPVMEQTTTGDVMEMPAEIMPGETLPVTQVDFPRRGMSMSRVENELGRPIDISPTVGQPPITSWSYDDRKVFFEGDLVIHVVAN